MRGITATGKVTEVEVREGEGDYKGRTFRDIYLAVSPREIIRVSIGDDVNLPNEGDEVTVALRIFGQKLNYRATSCQPAESAGKSVQAVKSA